jgi:hypothetical protein
MKLKGYGIKVDAMWRRGDRCEGEGVGLLEAGNQGRALRIINLVLYSHFEITNFPKYFVKGNETENNFIQTIQVY